MKKIIIVFVFALGLSASAQEGKSTDKTTVKTESAVSQKDVVVKTTQSSSAKSKVIEGVEVKELKKDAKSCKKDGSCCGGGDKSSKK